MKISKRNVFTLIRKSVLSFIVVMIISLLGMTIVNSLQAEVFTATAYCSCKKCCDKDPSKQVVWYYGVRQKGKMGDCSRRQKNYKTRQQVKD